MMMTVSSFNPRQFYVHLNSSFSGDDNLLSASSTSSSSCAFNCKCNVMRFHWKKRSVYLPSAKKKDLEWWERFFFDEQGNWFGWKEEYDDLSPEREDDSDLGDSKSKFEAWKRRAEAITELREAQNDMANQESRRWEDWLHYEDHSPDWQHVQQNTTPLLADNDNDNDNDDDDLLYPDRVFRYASLNSAKFLAILIIVPWCLDFVVHDYALMPFLDRYVKSVPLAAQILDVTRQQKLEIIDQIKMEQARIRLEVQIGRSPPVSDDQLWSQMHAKALHLREERRFNNRSAFANLWSDMLFGLSLFVILYANPNQVALLKFTGYKIINNVSDTGKAFLIILITDIFLGYHSESGWQTLVEIITDHYGLQVDQSAITIFICLVPVIMDACVKLWLFKFLPRLSPKVSNIFREMKRH